MPTPVDNDGNVSGALVQAHSRVWQFGADLLGQHLFLFYALSLGTASERVGQVFEAQAGAVAHGSTTGRRAMAGRAGPTGASTRLEAPVRQTTPQAS
jgi:hypothetical protein